MSKLSDTQIIIIGGGAVGCGVAYQLAEAGHTDVLLIEKEPTLAAVTTPQAAGLVGQVRTTVERVRLAQWSVKTFNKLQQDEETNPGWRQTGSLRIASCDERVAEFESMLVVAREADLELEFISPQEAQEKCPVLDFKQAKAVLWCPTDGYLQPSDLTMAYAKHSRTRGVRFQTNTAVERIVVENGRVVGVETDKGYVRCETVINAAGAHAYHLAKSAGIELPIIPVRHEYLVTVHAEGWDPSLPVIRIPDKTLYLRAETNALLLGGWEPNGSSTDPRSFETQQNPPNIEADWDVLGAFVEQLSPHYPASSELGIRSVFKGWPTFTPDGLFIVGPSCRVRGLVMAGGCNAHGVSGSAGIGRHVVESLFETDPSPYVKSMSPDRFTETSWDWKVAERSARQKYESYYTLK